MTPSHPHPHPIFSIQIVGKAASEKLLLKFSDLPDYSPPRHTAPPPPPACDCFLSPQLLVRSFARDLHRQHVHPEEQVGVSSVNGEPTNSLTPLRSRRLAGSSVRRSRSAKRTERRYGSRGNIRGVAQKVLQKFARKVSKYAGEQHGQRPHIRLHKEIL